MALSNIFVEPCREITESMVGVGLAAFLAWGDWEIASRTTKTTKDLVAALVILPLTVGVAVAFLVAVLILTHKLGEALCDWLADAGLDPRPKLRRRVRLDGSVTGWH